MKNISNEELLDNIYKDHLNLLVLAADIVGHSISPALWQRVHSMLSPTSKVDITDPLMVSTRLIPLTTFRISKYIEFKGSKKLKLYIEYLFPEYDAAALSLFLAGKGSILKTPQTFDIPELAHLLSIGVDESAKTFGIITLQTASKKLDVTTTEKCKDDDNLYERVLDIINTLES